MGAMNSRERITAFRGDRARASTSSSGGGGWMGSGGCTSICGTGGRRRGGNRQKGGEPGRHVKEGPVVGPMVRAGRRVVWVHHPCHGSEGAYLENGWRRNGTTGVRTRRRAISRSRIEQWGVVVWCGDTHRIEWTGPAGGRRGRTTWGGSGTWSGRCRYGGCRDRSHSPERLQQPLRPVRHQGVGGSGTRFQRQPVRQRSGPVSRRRPAPRPPPGPPLAVPPPPADPVAS